MFTIRTRYKILAWVALVFIGVLTATVAGPMYASHYWPDELAPSALANGTTDFNELMLSMEKAKPIAATANKLIALGNFITAGAIVGLALTSYMHFRKRKRDQRRLAEESSQIAQQAR